MHNDHVWMGDECIAPWDPRNFGPEWERITPTIYSPMTVTKQGKTSEKDKAAGLTSMAEFAAGKGKVPMRLFSRIARCAGLAPAKKTQQCPTVAPPRTGRLV